MGGRKNIMRCTQSGGLMDTTILHQSPNTSAKVPVAHPVSHHTKLTSLSMHQRRAHITNVRHFALTWQIKFHHLLKNVCAHFSSSSDNSPRYSSGGFMRACRIRFSRPPFVCRSGLASCRYYNQAKSTFLWNFKAIKEKMQAQWWTKWTC